MPMMRLVPMTVCLLISEIKRSRIGARYIRTNPSFVILHILIERGMETDIYNKL